MDRFVSAVRLAKSVLGKKRSTTAIVSLDEFVAVTEELCSDLEALSESSEPSPKALDPVRTNLELVTQALAVESKAPLRRRPCAAHFFASLPHACAVQRLCDLGARVDASAWGARGLALQAVAALLRASGPRVAVLPHLHVHLPLCHLLRATAKHIDARLYANAADKEPFTEVDDMEQAALASLVLELWQRPDRGDYFLVEDPALRFPPQFDLVSSVAPLLFRASHDANIGHFAQASLLHAARLHRKRVDLFVVHHSGVCGLLAGALTSSFEVLPRDLAPFHIDAANKQDSSSSRKEEVQTSSRASSRRLSKSSGTVIGLKVAFEGFMERWAFCDAMLHASWTARDATSWVTSQRPRTRSRAGSFGRRCSTLETLVNANALGRGYETASIFIALLEAITNGFVLASLRRQLLGACFQVSNQRQSLSSAGDESREIPSGTRRRSCSSSGDSMEVAAEKAADAAQTFIAWGLSEHHGSSDSNSSRHEGWRDVIQEPYEDSSRPPSRLLATAAAHALVSGDGGAELCAVLVQRLTRGKTIYNTSREANEQASKKTEGTAQQQDAQKNTSSASLSAGELLLQLLRLCAGGPELLDLCLGHSWERRIAALKTAKSEVGSGSSDGVGINEGNTEDLNVNNNNDSNLDHGTTCVDHNGDSSLDASLKSRSRSSVPIEDAPGWFAAAFPGSAIARWTCVELGPDSPVKPNSGAAVGAPDGAYGESVEKYLEVAEEEQVRRMLNERQQQGHKIPRRRRRCYYCTSSSCENESESSSECSRSDPVANSSGLVKGVAARVRDVLSMQREEGIDDSRSAPVPLEEALAVTGLVAELAKAAAAAAAVAAVSSADAELTEGSKGSSRSSKNSNSPGARNSAAEVHLGSSCCCDNLEARGARALHAAVFGHFAPTSLSAAAPVPSLDENTDEEDANHKNDHDESVCAALAACWHQVSKAVRGIFDSRRKLVDLRSRLGILKPKKASATSSHESTASVKNVLNSSSKNGNDAFELPDGPEGRALTLYVILDECLKEIFGVLSAGVLLQAQFKPSTVLTESSAPLRRSDAPSSNTANTTASPVGGGGLNGPVAPSGGGADASFAGDDGDEEEEANGFGSFDPNELENLFARFMPEDPFFFDAPSLGNGGVFGESAVGSYEGIAISATSAEVPSGEGHDPFGFGNL